MNENYQFEGMVNKKYFYDSKSEFGIYQIYTMDDIPYSRKIQGRQKFKQVVISGNLPELQKGVFYNIIATPKYNDKYHRMDYYVRESNIVLSEIKDIKSQQDFFRTLVTENQAENILAIYPNIVQDIIDKKEIDYSLIKGIGQYSWERIEEKVLENYRFMEIFNLLKPYKLPMTAIKRVSEISQNSLLSKQKLLENPYILTSIKGIGFKKADEIALKIAPQTKNSLERSVAFLKYFFIDVLGDNGDCWITQKQLIKEVSNFIPECLDVVKNLIKEQSSEGNFLFCHNECIGLSYLYEMEKNCFERLKKINNYHLELFSSEEIANCINSVEEKQGFCFTKEQKSAIQKVLNSNLSIICGKAGTGKTSITRGILKALSTKYNENEILCCSLSAKASQRISEATGFKAMTIHRAISSIYKENEEGAVVENQQKLLPYKVILVDESSMLNITIFYKLIMAIPENSKVILCGDNRQLPPIGVGNLFDNLINYSDVFNCISLSKVMRQSEDSGILNDANLIREGIKPNLSVERKDMKYIFKNSKEEIFNSAINNYLKAVSKYGMDNVVIVVPRKKQCQNCTYEINLEIQKRLFGNEVKCIKSGKKQFKVGDKVIHTKNNYLKNVFNGEVGYVKRITNEEMEVEYPDFLKSTKANPVFKSVKYSKETFSQIELAYALTAHSAQGSGYDVVIGIIDASHYIMLDRCILYTMITRAKKKCLILAEPAALDVCVNNNKVVKRKTWTSLKIFD